MTRIVFLGTPQFSIRFLKTLTHDEDFEVVGVVTQPDRPAGRKMKMQPSPIKQFCQEQGLEVISPDNVNQKEILDKVRSWEAQSAVVVAFGQILSRDFLESFPCGCVNIHTSLLPRWRGAAPIQRAILEGDLQSGVTLQILHEILDAGPILGQRAVEIGDLNAIELSHLLEVKGQELLLNEYKDALNGQIQGQVQDETRVTYAKKIKKSEGQINWNQDSIKIERALRAFIMGPGCWTTRSGKKLKIHQAQSLLSDHSDQIPGTISETNSESFTVICKRGTLKIKEVQPESRGKMKVSDYLRGNPIKIGDQLGT